MSNEMTAAKPDPPLFTSEPMLNRALAAEIRHDPTNFTTLLTSRLKVDPSDLGALDSVHCEGAADIDIVVRYSGANKPVTIGIEAKVGHGVTKAQLVKQNDESALDRVLLLLLDATDAPDFVTEDNPVLTWDEVLKCFNEPRLKSSDVTALPIAKARIRRDLRELKEHLNLNESDWSVTFEDNGNGTPAITIRSRPLKGGREIRGQIQARRIKNTDPYETVRYEFHIGIQVARDVDFPPDLTVEPAWIGHLRILKGDIAGRTKQLGITRRSGSGAHPDPDHPEKWTESRETLRRKMDIANEFLPDGRWLFHGYTDDWAIGVRSFPVAPEDLGGLADRAVTVLTDWWTSENLR